MSPLPGCRQRGKQVAWTSCPAAAFQPICPSCWNIIASRRSHNSFRGGLVMLRPVVLVALVTAIMVGGANSSHAQFGAVGGVYIDPNGMLRETSTLTDGDLRAKLQSIPGEAKPSQQVS